MDETKHVTSSDNPSALGWAVGYEPGTASDKSNLFSASAKMLRNCKFLLLTLVTAWSMHQLASEWLGITSHCLTTMKQILPGARNNSRISMHAHLWSPTHLWSHLLDPTFEECCDSAWIALSCLWRWERSISPMQFFESVWTRFTSIRACSWWGGTMGFRLTYVLLLDGRNLKSFLCIFSVYYAKDQILYQR